MTMGNGLTIDLKCFLVFKIQLILFSRLKAGELWVELKLMS
jgi:hypothetical protein